MKEVAGYDEDVVFLVVLDGSDFGKRVPIVIGTCTLTRVINVIKETRRHANSEGTYDGTGVTRQVVGEIEPGCFE